MFAKVKTSYQRYYCPAGHVVGLISREGHGVSRLLYLRQSIDESCATLAEPDVAAVIDSGDVCCSICAASMVWVPSGPALEKLLRGHKKLLVGLRVLESEAANPGFGG